jgi:hypothetical protein
VLAYNTRRSLNIAGKPMPACANISARRWAELEPENGAAWLEIAAEAGKRNDENARRDAMMQAAQAPRFDQHATELLRPLASSAARDAEPFDRLGLQVAVIGVYAATPYMGYMEASGFCKLPDDPERRTLCDRLATRLVDGDTTLIGRAVGRRIGAAAGCPAERLAALKDEEDALGWALQRDLTNRKQICTCGSLARMERRNLAILRQGEVGASRLEVARLHRTTAELARDYRAFARRERERAAAFPDNWNAE